MPAGKSNICSAKKKGIDSAGPDSRTEREDARKQTAEKGIIITEGISDKNVTKKAQGQVPPHSPHAAASEPGLSV